MIICMQKLSYSKSKYLLFVLAHRVSRYAGTDGNAAVSISQLPYGASPCLYYRQSEDHCCPDTLKMNATLASRSSNSGPAPTVKRFCLAMSLLATELQALQLAAIQAKSSLSFH